MRRTPAAPIIGKIHAVGPLIRRPGSSRAARGALSSIAATNRPLRAMVFMGPNSLGQTSARYARWREGLMALLETGHLKSWDAMGDRRLRFFSIGWRGGRACRTADTLKPPVADPFLRTTVSARPSRRIPISFQVFTGERLMFFC
jgi:hypothetical protein